MTHQELILKLNRNGLYRRGELGVALPLPCPAGTALSSGGFMNWRKENFLHLYQTLESHFASQVIPSNSSLHPLLALEGTKLSRRR